MSVGFRLWKPIELADILDRVAARRAVRDAPAHSHDWLPCDCGVCQFGTCEACGTFIDFETEREWT